MVINVVRKTPHFISLSMVKIKVTPLGIVASSRKGLNIKTILNMEKIITRRSSKKLTSCRQNLATKGPNKKLNKAFSKKKAPKEETVVLDDTLDRNSSSSSEADNYPDEDEKTSIAYDSYSADNDEISNSYISSEEKKLTQRLQRCIYHL